MSILTPGKGDVKQMWNRNNTEEVNQARKTFEELRGKGYHAFKVAQDGGKAEQIHIFDPDAEKIILAPPMRGGM